jgi:hypothetical protein
MNQLEALRFGVKRAYAKRVSGPGDNHSFFGGAP